jgi:alpha-beta hydrolase superfamily lysophospholipase
MVIRTVKLLKWAVVLLAIALAAVLVLRAIESQRGPQLQLWHTYVPRDLDAAAIGAVDWNGYLAAENKLFDDVRTNVTQKLDDEARNPGNRYFEGSPIYPGRFKTDWNRSYVMEPAGAPIGAVVMLHGLTDSPYSLRHLSRLYRDRGYIVVAPRLPGHGTVPSGLTNVHWEDWAAATRMAAREAHRRTGPGKPLHMIGFSNGGALAMKYTLDTLGDKALPPVTRVVLISPMIGVTSLARFAGIFGWPAVFPPFAKASWLGIVPEFNPFKYNSFPVNGARQSSLAARALQREIAQYAGEGKLAALPPVLTFQSVVDFTVSTQAIVDALYVHLPDNGSELVLFDLNRYAKFGPLLRASNDNVLARLLPAPPRRYRTTIVTNASSDTREVVAQVTEAGATTVQTRPLGLEYSQDVFSLSHLALPFPLTDSLYGLQPDSSDEDFGVQLGAMSTRGERGILIVSLDSLFRMSSNPFFPYLRERVDEGIGAGVKAPARTTP